MARLNFITLEKLMEMKENEDDFTLIEVLSEDAYNKEHIPGAINIPADEIEDRAESELDKDKVIVVYCANYHCKASTKAGNILTDMGFEYVLDYKAGKKAWKEADLEME